MCCPHQRALPHISLLMSRSVVLNLEHIGRAYHLREKEWQRMNGHKSRKLDLPELESHIRAHSYMEHTETQDLEAPLRTLMPGPFDMPFGFEASVQTTKIHGANGVREDTKPYLHVSSKHHEFTQVSAVRNALCVARPMWNLPMINSSSQMPPLPFESSLPQLKPTSRALFLFPYTCLCIYLKDRVVVQQTQR